MCLILLLIGGIVALLANDQTQGVLLAHARCKLVTTSCSPKSLASYFDPPSSSPFQISPAFFKTRRPQQISRGPGQVFRGTTTPYRAGMHGILRFIG